MKKLYCYKEKYYGIVDERIREPKIYWVNEDFSPEWSNYVHRQKSMYFSDLLEIDLEFICELDFDYEPVGDLDTCASLD